MDINIDISFILTYNLIEDYDTSLELYRIQLLQFFKINNYCDKTISDITNSLYDYLNKNIEIIEILEKIYNLEKINIDNISMVCNENQNKICFQLLMGYDYLYMFHKCLVNYINNNNNNSTNKNNLYFKQLNILIK